MEKDPQAIPSLSSSISYEEKIRQSEEQCERLRQAKNQAQNLRFVNTSSPDLTDKNSSLYQAGTIQTHSVLVQRTQLQLTQSADSSAFSYDLSKTPQVQYQNASKLKMQESLEIPNNQHPRMLNQSLLREVNNHSRNSNQNISSPDLSEKKNFNDSTTGYLDERYEQQRIPLSENHFIPQNKIRSNILDDSVYDLQNLRNQIKQPVDQSVVRAIVYLDQKVNAQTLSKGDESHQSLKGNKYFQYDEKTGLYWIDFMSKQGMKIMIGQIYLEKLRKVNKYLINCIKIGSKIKCLQVQKLLGEEFESLQYLELERVWQKVRCEQHAFDMIKNPKNLKNIKHLTLKGNFFSRQFLKEPNSFKLPKLEILELNFDIEMESQQLYDLLCIMRQFKEEFNVKLWSSRKVEDLKGDIDRFYDYIKIEWKDTKPNQSMIEELAAIQKEKELARKKEQERKEELAIKEQMALKEKLIREEEERKKKEDSQKTSNSYSFDNKYGKVDGNVTVGHTGNNIYHYKR